MRDLTFPSPMSWFTQSARFLPACVALLGAACIRRAPGAPGAAAAAAGPAVAATVTLAPAERHQRLEGFGASIAWHLDRVAGNPAPGLYETLFPELGLDILRLRNRYQRSEVDDRDLGQEVEILRRATQVLGHPPRILMSSWAPPAALKANGQERCRANKDCTLRREGGRFVYEKFGDYWRDSLAHYATLGILPEWVSIENEPSFIPPDWEGCRFDPTESADYPGYDRALAAVHAKIAALPRPPKLLGPEVLGIHHGLLERYLAPMNVDLVDGIAHHLYEMGDDKIWDWRNPGPDSFVDEMQGVAAAARGKPLFQTEFSTQDDHGVDGGFETAWLIHHSLVEEGAVAFLYWDLVWQPSGGLVSVSGRSYKIRDQYYALRHYARFTDPGYVRVGARSDAAPVRASAFLSPDGAQLAVVVLNTGKAPADVRVDAGGFAPARSAVTRTVFHPPRSETWTDLGPLAPGGSVPLPPRSVATVVLFAK
jgi:glucuronoarabinoxylan endo-1,4-beta-xylanase